jgi:hypothetical protein
MRSFNRRIIGLCAAVAIALGASLVVAQHSDKDHNKMGGGSGGGAGMQMPKPGTPEAAKMAEEMEKKMMEAGMPGPEHQGMAKGAGTYDAEVKFLDMKTGQWSPPMKGTMTMEPIFDGRYMMMKYKGEMMMGNGQKMPFEGMGIQGYDNTKKKYFSTWIDSMSTMMMKSEGTMEGNTVTLWGTMTDPSSGQDIKCKEVVQHKDNDHMSYEMYCDMGGGNEMKMMDIQYTRKK